MRGKGGNEFRPIFCLAINRTTHIINKKSTPIKVTPASASGQKAEQPPQRTSVCASLGLAGDGHYYNHHRASPRAIISQEGRDQCPSRTSCLTVPLVWVLVPALAHESFEGIQIDLRCGLCTWTMVWIGPARTEVWRCGWVKAVGTQGIQPGLPLAGPPSTPFWRRVARCPAGSRGGSHRGCGCTSPEDGQNVCEHGVWPGLYIAMSRLDLGLQFPFI